MTSWTSRAATGSRRVLRPVQLAFGRAKRTQSEFAGRHGLAAGAVEQLSAGLASQGAAALIGRAVEAAAEADQLLAELQDSMLPVEAGDAELRAGLASIREPLGGLPARARGFLRGLGAHRLARRRGGTSVYCGGERGGLPGDPTTLCT